MPPVLFGRMNYRLGKNFSIPKHGFLSYRTESRLYDPYTPSACSQCPLLHFFSAKIQFLLSVVDQKLPVLTVIKVLKTWTK